MKLRTVISGATLALLLIAGTAGIANAGQPTDPGCFGAGRSAFATPGGDTMGNAATTRRCDGATTALYDPRVQSELRQTADPAVPRPRTRFP